MVAAAWLRACVIRPWKICAHAFYLTCLRDHLKFEYNQRIAGVIAACTCKTWTKALSLHPYISPYLCMKWRFTMGPSLELMYQLLGFFRSGWHLRKLKSARALFTDEWSFGARRSQAHAHLAALSIHGKYIPMQPVVRDILKHEWNLNEIFTSLRGAVHRSHWRVSHALGGEFTAGHAQ